MTRSPVTPGQPSTSVGPVADVDTDLGPEAIADAARPVPTVRAGHCQCGDIAYQVTGDPDDPHLCSCPHETRISGGPAVLWVGFRKDTLSWTGPGGEPTWYSTYLLRTTGKAAVP